MYKHISIVLIAVLAATLITSSVVSFNAADAKKPTTKTVKCNNIKILVKVSGVKENQTYTANVQLGTGNKTKSGVADDNISLSLPVAFHKISPCPAMGFPFSGDVNGTAFDGKITSLKKPNKVTVNVS